MRTTAKLGIDATAPLGQLEEFTPPRIPGAERYHLARYFAGRDGTQAGASGWSV